MVLAGMDFVWLGSDLGEGERCDLLRLETYIKLDMVGRRLDAHLLLL